MRTALWLALGLATAIGWNTAAESATPVYHDKTNILVYINDAGATRPVQSPDDWQHRRRHILGVMQEVMGPLPDVTRKTPLNVETVETVDLGKVVRKKILFTPEQGDRVPAYLLIPKQLRDKAPAMLCLHPTAPTGKAVPAGVTAAPERNYALELAERGYVTLAPDYPNFGEYRFDPYAHGYVSATMKGIWNHVRAVDVLQSLPEVDPGRIGVIGHSLGGHNAIFVAVFDPRIRLVVASSSFNAFPKYYGGDLTGWSHRGYMPRIAAVYGKDPKRVPFDFPEVIAALAPRPVFVNAPLHDDNFEKSGVDDCLNAARPVYKFMNSEDRLQAVFPEGGHGFSDDSRKAAYAFIDRELRTPIRRNVSRDIALPMNLTNPLGVRLASYGKYQAAGWKHLPSIGVQSIYLGVPAPAGVEALQAQLKESRLSMHVLGGSLNVGTEAGLDALVPQLETCRKMGVRYLFISPKHPDASKQVAYERLRKAGDAAAKYGVTLVVETHPDLGTNADVQLETMRAVNHPNVRINFDTGNITFYNRGADAVAELKKIIDYVATVELKDHTADFMTWNFPTLGKGAVDFPGVLKVLEEHKFRGPITIEVEGIQGLEMTEEQTLQYIADSVAYVRTLGKFQ